MLLMDLFHNFSLSLKKVTKQYGNKEAWAMSSFPYPIWNGISTFTQVVQFENYVESNYNGCYLVYYPVIILQTVN